MDTVCYVYAILPAGAALPSGLAGMDGAPLWTVTAHGLAAVVSAAADATSPPATLDHLRRHEAVVEAIGHAAPALPVRFGTVLADATAVSRALAAQAPTLTDDLRRVGGKVEMSVTILVEASGVEASGGAERTPVVGAAVAPPGDADGSGMGPLERAQGAGAAYLRERLAQHHQQARGHARGAALAERLDHTLGVLAAAHRMHLCPAPRLLLRAHYLLVPAGVETFQRTFDDLRHELRHHQPDLRLLLSGPWPPYSFVSVRQEAHQTGKARAASERRVHRL